MRPFSEFASEHDMYKTWELHDYGGKKVCATTFLGRKASLGYLNCILKEHKAGFCWDGSFSLDDFVVLAHNGVPEFVIMKKAYEGYSKEKAIADFTRFCDILFRYFKANEADEKYPSHFDQFQNDYLINMPNREDTQAYDRWQNYMAHHFAFKAPQAISNLIIETHMVYDASRTAYNNVSLNNSGDLKSWTSDVKNSGSISLVETYKYGIRSNTNRYDVLSYWSTLAFGRNFICHMLCTKMDGGVLIQVQDLQIVELMLGFVLDGQMAKVIRYIMETNGFSGGLLSSAWRHFQASETFD